MESKLKKKYQKELAVFKPQVKDFKSTFLTFLDDLKRVGEVGWDYGGIRYETVMNMKEWKNFSTHPDRLAYKSKAVTLPSNPDKRLDYFLSVIKDAFKYYSSINKSQYKSKLQASIGSLILVVIEERYHLAAMWESDKYIGRTKAQRDNGEVVPTKIQKSKFDFAITTYSKEAEKDAEDLKNQFKKAFKLNSNLLIEFILTTDMDIQLRKDIYGVLNVYRRDQTLAFSSIRRAWEVWRHFRSVGIDTDSFLDLNGLPNYETTTKRLLSFLSNKALIKEALAHMQDDLPQSYRVYKKQSYISYIQISSETAKRKKYPKKLKEQSQIDQMVKRSKNRVYKYFPLGKKQTPRNILLNPTHPASTTRAFQSSLKNSKGEQISITVMTPRSDNEDMYLRTFAHEMGHLLHSMILNMGEKTQILEQGARDRVPMAVMEDFSQLIEHQFSGIETLPYKKKFKGKEFPNFMSSLIIRRQGPFALMQLTMRKRFDELWDSGYKKNLTDEMIWNLKHEFDAKLKSWYSLGIDIRRPNLEAFSQVRPANPGDGLVYLKKYLSLTQPKQSISKSTPDNTLLTIPEAMKKRFGDKWHTKSDGRAMMYWLMLETGRNHKTEAFGKLLLKKPVSDVYSELKSINLSKGDI